MLLYIIFNFCYLILTLRAASPYPVQKPSPNSHLTQKCSDSVVKQPMEQAIPYSVEKSTKIRIVSFKQNP